MEEEQKWKDLNIIINEPDEQTLEVTTIDLVTSTPIKKTTNYFDEDEQIILIIN